MKRPTKRELIDEIVRRLAFDARMSGLRVPMDLFSEPVAYRLERHTKKQLAAHLSAQPGSLNRICERV